MITKERLEEDEKIHQRLDELWYKGDLTPEEKVEYNKLVYTYYVENDDIRIYWKTY